MGAGHSGPEVILALTAPAFTSKIIHEVVAILALVLCVLDPLQHRSVASLDALELSGLEVVLSHLLISQILQLAVEHQHLLVVNHPDQLLVHVVKHRHSVHQSLLHPQHEEKQSA